MQHFILLSVLILSTLTGISQTYQVMTPEQATTLIDSLKAQKEQPGIVKYWDHVLMDTWTSVGPIWKIALDKEHPDQIFTLQAMKNNSLGPEELVISGGNLRMSITKEGELNFASLDGTAWYILKKRGKVTKYGDQKKLEYYIAAAQNYFKEPVR